jgi:NADPH:quinone reductase-like Zn-dependent oxidoreductase
MKAVVYRSYGPPEVLKIEAVEKPSIQEGHDDRLLIKVRGASPRQKRTYKAEGRD